MNRSTARDPVARTIAAWRMAGEKGDAEQAAHCLTEGVEVISPLTAQFRFHGLAQVREMLAAAFAVISDIRYHTEVGDGSTRALFYHGRCGEESIEEAQLLRFSPDGLITQLTLFGRPLPGLAEAMTAIGPALLTRQGRPVAAKAIAAATRPLATAVRFGDIHLVPRADPSRAAAVQHRERDRLDPA